MKKLLILGAMALPLISGSVFADTVRTSDGISCSFDSDDSPWEIKGYTEKGSSDRDSSFNDYDEDKYKVGASVTYRFGGPERLECQKLYDLELRSKTARVRQLEEQVRALEATNSVEW